MTANVDQVRLLYAAFARGDLDVLDEVLAADVRYVNPDYAIEGGVRRGVDEFRCAWQGLLDDFHWDDIELWRVEELGDQVVVEFCTEGSGKMSGAPVSDNVSHVWSFRDGRVSRFQRFQTYDEALAAAGVRTESEDAAMVRRLYELWQAGDTEQALAQVDPGIEWIEPPDSPESETHLGPRGIVFSTDRWTAGFEDWSIEVERVRDLREGKVLVDMRQRARARGSSVDVEALVFHLWTVVDGRAVRLEMYMRESEALAASAGPSRPEQHA